MDKSILLIGKYSVVEPLGLMFLSSAIKKAGHQSEIFLIKDENGGLISRCYSGDYDFIGFSVFTGYHKQMFSKMSALRNNFEIIMGGPHATYFADSGKEHADYVVVGEGLQVIKQVLDGKTKQGVVFNSSLLQGDKIPMPDREILYNTNLDYKQNKIKNVMTSFGCPFSCHYCYNDSYKKLYPLYSPVRQRPVEHVIEECRNLLQYPLELIFFQDDCFGFNTEWLEKFAVEYSRKVKIPFHCQMRPETVTYDRMKLLQEAGCHGITMAIETIDENIRETLLNRHMSSDCVNSAGKLVKHFGFKLRTEQMLGLPETTLEDELELLKLNVAISPDIAWSSIFAPYLGTTLGDYCKERKLYNGDNDDLSDTFFSDSKLSFDPERKRKTNMLQKIFATCARIPSGHLLAKEFLEGNDYSWDRWFEVMRKHLFNHSLYRVGEYNG